MEVLTASPVPAAKAVPPIPSAQLVTVPVRPMETSPATQPTQPAKTVPAASTATLATTRPAQAASPAHRLPSTSPVPTASHTPARPVPSAPPAQPAQTAAPSTTTTVPPSPTPTASHLPGSAQSEPATQPAPAGSVTSDEEPSGASTPAGEGRLLSDDLPEQVALEKEIVILWQECKGKTAIFGHQRDNVKQSKEEVTRLQAELDRALYEFKQHLSKTGRNGRWTPFLRDHSMARPTADRWAKRHELRIIPQAVIGPDEALSGPTEKDVTALVKKVAPGLILRLPTPDSVAQFLKELAAALQPSSSTP